MPLLNPLHDPKRASGTTTRHARDPFLVRVGLLVAAAFVVLDQATKHLAEQLLVRGRMVDVWADGWGFQLTYNPGGAFGFPAPTFFFLAVTVVVSGFVAYHLPRSTSATQATAWGLLLAGALGNALDRVFRPGGPGDPRYLFGEVVDFIAWGSFPRFNVADVAITSGFVLLVLSFWRDEQQAQESAEGSV